MSDDTPVPEEPSAEPAEPIAEPAEPSAPAKPVSFQTASGKAVSFTASKRTQKAKVVVEAPVEEEALPPEPPELKRSSAAQSVEAVPEAPSEKKPRGRPKGSTKKPAPGIQERLPPKQPITEVAPLPATPEPPAYPRMTQDEFHGLMTEFMQTSRSQRRDARLAMYRSWLST